MKTIKGFIIALTCVTLTCFSASASAMNWGEYNAQVTENLGAEVTLHTRRALAAEAQSEGGGAKNNLYNTTLRLPGSTSYNSVGVQNYVSPEQGVVATVKTLKQHCCGYYKIRRRLRANAPARSIDKGFGESEWGTNLTLVLAVLEDVIHNRWPNTILLLEAKAINR